MVLVCKRDLSRLNTWGFFSIMSFQSTFGEYLKPDFNRSRIKSLFCLGFACFFFLSFFLHLNSLLPGRNKVIIVILKNLR